MDALAGLLDGPRARGAFVIRSVLDPPWALRIEDRAPATVMIMVRGSAWLMRANDDPVQIQPGDVSVICGPDGYTMADEPDTPPQVVIHPGQRCTTVDGTDLADSMNLGVRTWGTNIDGATMMLTGTYQLDTEVSSRLLESLPMSFSLPASASTSPIVALLEHEAVKAEPGQEAVLDRLLDLLLISVLREWFARPESEAPGWFLAHADPVIGPALRMLFSAPMDPWTVESLASEVGASRAAFARRFNDLVGEPPMTFLTNWRLTLAADMLREPGVTLSAVAREVGYSTPYALSNAFKRVHGVSPKQYRLARA